MTRTPAGQVQTVLGAVAPDAIGVTLPHEHLLIDFKVMFAEPTAASDKGRAWEPLSLANLGWVRQNFNANLDNLRLVDEQVAQDEILLFKHAGGQTVVDPTPKTLGRDPQALARVARATGLNVIMGAGYYQPVTQWAKGEYSGANSQQDELASIATYGGTPRTDDYGDTAETAYEITEPLSGGVTKSGVISTTRRPPPSSGTVSRRGTPSPSTCR